MSDSETIKNILKKYKTVAVVGLSRDPTKDSYRVAKYLTAKGYDIIPVNPTADEVLGKKSYKTLLDVPEEVQKKIDIVDIFRKPLDVPPIVDQAIQLRSKHGRPYVVWMQLGIVNGEAANHAMKAGLKVVMDRCMMREHERLSEGKDL